MNYYDQNPVLSVTVFGSEGLGELLVTNTMSAIMQGLRESDAGWMRGDHIWTATGERFVLPSGGYAIDPTTLEITLL